jgi:peptidoglycan/LPS O-acetylase OafA/YrhL
LTRNEIRPLTGIRGVAALFVAVYHLNGFNAPPQLQVPGLASVVLDHGYLAVDLFFVLSGYVMALSYGEMVRVWNTRNYLRFLIRRVARVYPLFALITLFIALMLFTGVSHETIPDAGSALGWNLLMLQGWGFATSIDGPSWSISTEWGAYLVFPILAAVTLFGNRRTLIATLAVAAGTVVLLAVLPFGDHGPLDIYGPGSALARCLAEFTLGLMAFRAAQQRAVQAWARRPASGLLLAAAIVALLCWHGTDLAIVALLPAFIVTLGVGRGPVQAVLGSPLLFLAGEISYALYLLHTRFVRFQQVLDAKLAPHLGAAAPLVTCVVMYGVLLMMAWLAFRFIEKPARSWLRRAERLVPSGPLQHPAPVAASHPEALPSD